MSSILNRPSRMNMDVRMHLNSYAYIISQTQFYALKIIKNSN